MLEDRDGFTKKREWVGVRPIREKMCVGWGVVKMV